MSRYIDEYNRKHYREFKFRISLDNPRMLDWLDSQRVAPYIRALIAQDMKDRGIPTDGEGEDRDT